MQWLLLIFIIPYFYIILRIFINLKKIKPFLTVSKSNVTVSVIVACHNEENNLPLLLKDISAQDYDPDLFEVIIVDDCSTDNTSGIVSDFNGIKNLKLITNKGRGKKPAIRSGIDISSGHLIITTDGDCRCMEKWISSVASFFEQKNPDMIIGPVSLKGTPGIFHRFQELEFLSLQGVTAGTAMEGNPAMCNGANLAFKKDTYLKHSANLHDEIASGDDIFFIHSLKKEPGNKILWLESDNAVVTTSTSETTGSFLNQRARWISKAAAYDDKFTKILGLVTLLAVLVIIFTLIPGIFYPAFISVFFTAIIIKSVPDYLILKNTTIRYGRKDLMKWFLISEIIYPFYVFAVLLRSLRGGGSSRHIFL